MTIKEVEERTGLTRSNIRFYEKEKLIEPSRNDKVSAKYSCGFSNLLNPSIIVNEI